jgi:hypothetical protein
MASKPRIQYRPYQYVTPEAEARTLAAVYAYVLRCHEQKKPVGEVGGDKNTTAFGYTESPPEEHPNKDGSA